MGNDIRLRDVSEDDLPILFEQQLDPDATRMAAFPSRDREAFMEHWTRLLRDESVTKKTIVFDGRVAGNIGSWEQAGQQRVGYWIGREYWGRGIATRALAEFLRHVITRPLHAYVASHNVASIKVLERCGFTLLQEEKGSARGEEHDEVILILAAGQRDEVE